MSEPQPLRQGRLVALDWGTSSLRAALLGDSGQVLEERSFPHGILNVAPGEFATVFVAACADWERPAGQLALISGMAGSRQGWLEAPYCACPAGFGELARQLAWPEPGRVAIVPGLSCEHAGVPDVMRGEETQVFGALDLLGIDAGTFVLPGTHSKWVDVAQRRIRSFRTFMTGEFYALLRRHSILARTLAADDGELDEAAFLRGVQKARDAAGLLANAFSARALALFERLPAAAAPSYLSGLVIGEELRAQLAAAAPAEAVLIGAPALTRRYALALDAHGVRTRSLGGEATWRGLWAIAQTLENR
jgi:2-dehydro-3-deoxygalactonokinase